jgi:hypothetical protein
MSFYIPLSFLRKVVTPAKAGAGIQKKNRMSNDYMDSRLRGNDNGSHE